MSNFWTDAPHVAVGSITLFLYWRTILSTKGSATHRRFGRLYLMLLIPVLVSVVPISARAIVERGGVAAVQFIYLVFVLCAAGWTAWRAIADKHDPDRFRGLVFRALAVALTGSGVLLLVVGIVSWNVLAVGLSMIGVVFGGAMIGFIRRAAAADWWLEWHLNGVCLLFAATHASFVGLVFEWLWPAWRGDELHAMTQLGTIVVAYLLRQWLGWRYQSGPSTAIGRSVAPTNAALP